MAVWPHVLPTATAMSGHVVKLAAHFTVHVHVGGVRQGRTAEVAAASNFAVLAQGTRSHRPIKGEPGPCSGHVGHHGLGRPAEPGSPALAVVVVIAVGRAEERNRGPEESDVEPNSHLCAQAARRSMGCGGVWACRVRQSGGRWLAGRHSERDRGSRLWARSGTWLSPQSPGMATITR